MSVKASSVRSRPFSGLLGASLFAMVAVVLSGCEVTEASGNNYNSGAVCPMNYDPVCAERRGQERTFPNACQARAEDWRVVSSGQCRATGYGEYRSDQDRDYRGRDYRGRDERNPYYRNRDDRGRDYRNPDYRNPSRDRNVQPDYNPPRFGNQPDRTPGNRPGTRPDRVEQPTYQPPVRPAQPVRPATPPVQPSTPSGACAKGMQRVCGQLGTTTQWFTNQCQLESVGGTMVDIGTCMRNNR